MPYLNVTVPPGVGAGGTVAFEDVATGRMLEAVVPDGVAEGETFQVEVDEDGSVHPIEALNSYVANRAAGGDVMDVFVAWFEREAVGEQIDAFISENASRIGSIPEAAEGEQSHEWWPIYQEYSKQFDKLLEQFLEEAACTVDQFMEAAKEAEGMNEMYLQLFLAHSNYEMFVEMMSQEAMTQQAKAELAAGV